MSSKNLNHKKSQMVELPNKVRVGFRDYQLLPLSGEQDPGDEFLGFHFGSQNIIMIDTEHTPPWSNLEIACTVLHEILHAIVSTAEAPIEEEKEEWLVSMFGNGLTQVFRDNPEVINWILQLCQKDTEEKTSKVR